MHFLNSLNEKGRPYTGIEVGAGKGKNEDDSQWVLKRGQAEGISFESVLCEGLYLTIGEIKELKN